MPTLILIKVVTDQMFSGLLLAENENGTLFTPSWTSDGSWFWHKISAKDQEKFKKLSTQEIKSGVNFFA